MNRNDERNRDSALLSEAAEVVMGIVRGSPQETGDPEHDGVMLVAMNKAKLEACKVLPGLLERRAKLLGLDLVDKDTDGSDKPGSLASVERRLEIVQGKKGG